MNISPIVASFFVFFGTACAVAQTVANFTDNFANSALYSDFTVTGQGDTSNFTHEPGEPNQAGGTGTHSGWIGWQAPQSGPCLLNAGGNFNVVLAVYVGNSLANLLPVASADPTNTKCSLSFSAVTGTTYQIAIDGDSPGDFGAFSFSLQLQAPPVITAEPVNQVVALDGTTTFKAQAVGVAPLTYQWQLNGGNITDATNGYYTDRSVG
jgi:hypothetical protein